MNIVRTLSRWFVGLVFIFSGFVKGVDPLGTAFRIEDYLVAYTLEGFIPFSLCLSVLLCAFEFSLGVFLILNIKPRYSYWALLIIMSFFTIVTFYDAIYEPVPDCGCFGDVIILTNWQTFFKNIVLLLPTFVLFAHRNKAHSSWGNIHQWAVVSLVFAGFVWFSLFNYRNLPMIDFLAWKVGNIMVSENTEPLQFYLTYRNKQTGQMQEYLSPNFPFNDQEWLEQWEFVSQRVVDPNPGPHHNLQIFDNEANDMTEAFIDNPGHQFMLIVWKYEKVNRDALKKMNEFFLRTETDGHSFIAIAPSADEGKLLAAELQLDYEFYFADHVELKIMVRSNPGLILMKNGRVLAKWSQKNFPDYEEVKNILN
ncbi:MAG: DoxX family protein [Bacteroidales bacterium]|nr:DoxX family protein [Bacteroidales bacterium]MDZ4205544.1 DoxX family protein [Bacteroidales bacterium]